MRRWLVFLVQGNKVDQCITIDGTRKLIFDSEEEYPLRLSAECWRPCGGANVQGLQVAGIRELREAA